MRHQHAEPLERGAHTLSSLLVTPAVKELLPHLGKDIEHGDGLWDLWRRACASSLFWFCKTVACQLPPDQNLIRATTHGAMCRLLEDDDIKDLLIEMPRKTLKSTISTAAAPVHKMVRRAVAGEDPSDRIFILSHAWKIAQTHWWGIKSIVDNNAFFQFLFGEEVVPASSRWNENMGFLQRAMDRKDGTFEPIASQSAGKHCDWCIADDLINEENWDSPEAVQKATLLYKFSNNWLEGADSRRLVVGNRWGLNDLNSHIHRVASTNNRFVVLSVSASDGPNRSGEWRCKNLPDYAEEILEYMGAPLWPERLSVEYLAALKEDQGPAVYCTTGDAPVLMSDLSSKLIADVCVGDEVFSFDEHSQGKGLHRYLRRATVTAKHELVAPVVTVHLESGRTVRCTENHPWFRFRCNESGYGRVRVGDCLAFWCDPTNPSIPEGHERDAYWLGGLYDGEGTTGSFNTYIAQSIKVNPDVCSEIERVLSALGICFGYSDTDHVGSRTYYLRGGRDSFRRFFLLTKPCKARKALSKSLFDRRTADAQVRDRIVRIVPSGEEKVYSLETTERTYTVWGYLTHNSAQFENRPEDPDAMEFDATRIVGADVGQSDDGPCVKIDGDRFSTPFSALNLFVTWDPALDEKYSRSQNAIVVVGVDAIGRHIVLREHARVESPRTALKRFLAFCRAYGPWLKASGMEEVLFMKVLKNLLQEEARNHLIRLGIKKIKTPSKQSKEQRIRALLGNVIESGKLVIARNCPKTLDQVRLFGVKGAPRDLVDALAYAAQIASKPRSAQDVLMDEYEDFQQQDRGTTGYGF